MKLVLDLAGAPDHYTPVAMALRGSVRSAGGVALLVVTVGCEGRVESAVSPGPGDDAGVELTVWASAPRRDRYRTLGPQLAAARIVEPALRVVATSPPGSEGTFSAAVEEALRSGRAPDIVFVSQWSVVWWARDGWLEPLDACFEKPGALGQILPRLWPAVTWEGKVWGIPAELGVQPLFFSKPRLSELGWSSADIASLPERIATGAFTLDQLLDTAERAVNTGVVAPGFGYWPGTVQEGDLIDFYLAFGGRLAELGVDAGELDERALARAYERMRRLQEARLSPENLLRTGQVNLFLDRRLMRDTVAHERVLFWRSWLGDWALWALDHARDRGGRDYLFENVGIALVPSGIAGKRAEQQGWVTAYALTTPRASGEPHAGDGDRAVRLLAACALLEHTIRPEINLLLAVDAARLSVLRPEALAAAGPLDRLVAETAYLSEHLSILWSPPFRSSSAHAEVIMDESLAVLDGRASPQAAAAEAKRRLGAVPAKTFKPRR